MTDHMVEERIRESMGTRNAEPSTEEVIHLAFCDECSRLAVAIYLEDRKLSDVAPPHFYGHSGMKTSTAGKVHKWI
jgi:hypothetical protein